jgi:serine/threonine protein kinase
MVALAENTLVQNMITSEYCHFCLEPNHVSYPCPHCDWSPSAHPKSKLFLRPGTVLHGRFIIAKVLSHGEFSTVYLAWGIREQKKLAIKEFLPIGLVDRDTQSQNINVIPETQKAFYNGLNRFLDEGLVLGKFRKNPNIVDFHCLFKAYETGYAVMEYVEGVNLGTYIKAKGVLNWQHTLALFSRIMALMDLLHEQGVLHSGINPGSIILGKNNQIKLLGFATAKHALSKHMRANASINVSGYAAEEQYLANQQEGPWTDVYAIAACMYFCLTGHPPPDSLRIQYSDPLIKPSQLNVKIPESAELGLLKGLSINAALRPQTLADFHAALIKNNTETQAVAAVVPEKPVAKTVTPVEIKSTNEPKPTQEPTQTEAPKETTQRTVLPETAIAEQSELEKSSYTLKVLYGLLFTCFATASVIVFINTPKKEITAPEVNPVAIKPKISAQQSNVQLFNHAMLLKQQHRDNLAMPIFMHLARLGDQNAQAIINSIETEKKLPVQEIPLPVVAESKPSIQEKIQSAAAETKATFEKKIELPPTISAEELLVSTQNNPNANPLSKNQLQLAVETERLPAPSRIIAQPLSLPVPKLEVIAPVINLNAKPIKQNDSVETDIQAIFSSNQNEKERNHEDYLSKLFGQTQQEEQQELALYLHLFGDGDSDSSSYFTKEDQAKLGIPEIQALLASLYEKGNGVHQDFYQAQYWYKKAAEHGELSAIYYLEDLNRKSRSY